MKYPNVTSGVKRKAIELGYAARTVFQQFLVVDPSPETAQAVKLLSDALAAAVPNAEEPSEREKAA